MKVKEEKPECFGNFTNCPKDNGKNCNYSIKCIMSLYDKPLPELIIYSSDLVKR